MMIYCMKNLLIIFNELPLYPFIRREPVLIKIISRVKLETLLDVLGVTEVSYMGNE